MAVDKTQYIGKQLTWDEAVDIFPNLWVSFKDCIYHGVDFQSGTLAAVIEDNDIGKYICSHIEENPYFARTTENQFEGYVHGVFAVKENS